VITFAICTYNRADRLPRLVAALRAQSSPVPFEILVVNNNSGDHTLPTLAALTAEPGAPLRVVTEREQGIVPARNRAITEALASDVLAFIDDDELPAPGLVAAASDAVLNRGADCVGGRIDVAFEGSPRPRWLHDDLLGFLGKLDHGPASFRITTESTPVWTGDVAYRVAMFRQDPALRFDPRYNRAGEGVGGGEDKAMLRTLLQRGAEVWYRPDMAVQHCVDPAKLSRRYFLRLHYVAGVRFGRNELPAQDRRILGVPPYLVGQACRHAVRAAGAFARGAPEAVRQAMTAAHSIGTIVGCHDRWRAPLAGPSTSGSA
jgi:glycosyltransferase involved in cell wall biosynthesis